MKLRPSSLTSLVAAALIGTGLASSCDNESTKPKPTPIPQTNCVTSDTLADFTIKGRGRHNFKFNGYDCSVIVSMVDPPEIAYGHPRLYAVRLGGYSGDVIPWSDYAVIDSLPHRIFLNGEGDNPSWNDEDQRIVGALEIYDVTGCMDPELPGWRWPFQASCPAGYDTSTVSFRVLKCKEQ